MPAGIGSSARLVSRHRNDSDASRATADSVTSYGHGQPSPPASTEHDATPVTVHGVAYTCPWMAEPSGKLVPV